MQSRRVTAVYTTALPHNIDTDAMTKKAKDTVARIVYSSLNDRMGKLLLPRSTLIALHRLFEVSQLKLSPLPFFEGYSKKTLIYAEIDAICRIFSPLFIASGIK